MKGSIFFLISLFLMMCCHHQPNLSEQLSKTFSNHLKKIDVAASIDSIHILWNVPITEKLRRIIDDSIYVWEYSKIKSQLAMSLQTLQKDSIEYYQDEINYMNTEIDSINKSIKNADTANSMGRLIVCAFYMSKNEKSKEDSTVFVIDSLSTIRFSEYLDSALKRSLKSIQ